jgi:hypothetical protein
MLPFMTEKGRQESGKLRLEAAVAKESVTEPLKKAVGRDLVEAEVVLEKLQKGEWDSALRMLQIGAGLGK